jgi:hypothetical protein
VLQVSARAEERATVRLMMDIQLIDRPSPLNLVLDFSLEQP